MLNSFRKIKELPPADREGADFTCPMGDPEWVSRAECGAVTRALFPPAYRGVNH